MATITVVTESYVDVPDDLNDDGALARSIVKEALEADDRIYLVKETREELLLSR